MYCGFLVVLYYMLRWSWIVYLNKYQTFLCGCVRSVVIQLSDHTFCDQNIRGILQKLICVRFLREFVIHVANSDMFIYSENSNLVDERYFATLTIYSTFFCHLLDVNACFRSVCFYFYHILLIVFDNQKYV